jgi:YesN/AraC family two-component response regulator
MCSAHEERWCLKLSSRNYKVLIADDEYWVRENLRTILSWQEYSFDFLEPAVDGEDVLLSMEKECPDILFTDINMPFVNGVELVNIVKSRYPHVVTIILSGYSDFEYVRSALLAGAIDYILKPLTKINLINTLAKALEVISKNNILRQENETIKEELLQASSILQDKEFSLLVASDEFTFKENSSQFHISEMELDIIGFSLVLIKINNFSEVSKIKFKYNTNLLSYAVKNIIGEFVQNNKSIIFNNIYVSNEFVLISDLDKAYLDVACENILKALEVFFDSSVNIAISKYYYSMEKVHKAYNEALSALMSRLYRKGSSKTYIEEVEKLYVKKRITAEHEKKLIFAINNQNKKLLKQLVFDEIGLQCCHLNNWLFIEVRQTALRITSIIINNVTEHRLSLETLAMENLVELLDKTMDSFNISEVCSILEQLIEECFEITASYAANDTVKFVVKPVMEYINENYFEDISLNSLSKLFLVDGSYLSKLFKRGTGDNLMLYIAKKRIEKAIELIKQGNVSLTDISSLVGYNDYTYFNRVFRKVTGKGPREYKSIQSPIKEEIL